jgi:hypothetical protein
MNLINETLKDLRQVNENETIPKKYKWRAGIYQDEEDGSLWLSLYKENSGYDSIDASFGIKKDGTIDVNSQHFSFGGSGRDWRQFKWWKERAIRIANNIDITKVPYMPDDSKLKTFFDMKYMMIIDDEIALTGHDYRNDKEYKQYGDYWR